MKVTIEFTDNKQYYIIEQWKDESHDRVHWQQTILYNRTMERWKPQ